MNAIAAVFYRDYRQRITNAAFLFWDLFVPLAYLLLFGLGFERLLGGGHRARRTADRLHRVPAPRHPRDGDVLRSR